MKCLQIIIGSYATNWLKSAHCVHGGTVSKSWRRQRILIFPQLSPSVEILEASRDNQSWTIMLKYHSLVRGSCHCRLRMKYMVSNCALRVQNELDNSISGRLWVRNNVCPPMCMLISKKKLKASTMSVILSHFVKDFLSVFNQTMLVAPLLCYLYSSEYDWVDSVDSWSLRQLLRPFEINGQVCAVWLNGKCHWLTTQGHIIC
jgi:hypothetical protein